MTTELPAALVGYLAKRDAAHADAVAGFLDSLTVRERALFQEAAVMGYVQGRRHPQGEDHPKSSAVLALVVDACIAFPDQYPAVNYVLADATRLAMRQQREQQEGKQP